MHTLVAFSSSVANGVTYASLLGVLDQSLTLDAGNRVQSPFLGQVRAHHLMGANLSAGRINAPSLRLIGLPELYHGVAAAAVASGDGPVVYGDRGPRIQQGEGYLVEVSRAGAGAAQCFCGLWVSPQVIPASAGPAVTITGTAAITTVIGSWVLGSITFTQTLPAGTYEVVGMAVQAAGGVYARLVYPGGVNWRPGVVCQAAYGDRPWTQDFRSGRFGSFGRFAHNAPPSLEILGSAAAGITATVYLEVVKVS